MVGMDGWFSSDGTRHQRAGCSGVRHARCTCTVLPAVVLLLGLLLTGCAGSASVPSPTALPVATVAPTPEPTATAIPAVELLMSWPADASALEDITLEVQLPELAERDPDASVRARILDPAGDVWWESGLAAAEDGTYRAVEPLHLPLETPPGDWRLTIFIDAAVPVNGARTILFRPDPVPLRDLGGQVRPGISLLIPRPFAVVRYEGDEVAGARVWTRGAAEVGLWWVPGPAERLTQDTAQMLVDTTIPTEAPVELLAVEAVEWHDLAGFRFSERWPDGPAEALVVQGPDRWLVLLRVRALDGGPVPALLWDIQASFRVE